MLNYGYKKEVINMKQDKLLVAAMVIVGIILLGCIVAYVA